MTLPVVQAVKAGSRLWKFAKASVLTSSGVAVAASGAWVMYQDATRWPRMERTFATGNIIPPLDKDFSELAYFERTQIEDNLKSILNPHQTGRYHVVRGDVGSGKSRTLLHCVKQLMESDGRHLKGAPVYVAADQERTFVDALAESVSFYFDEHVNFNYFIRYMFGTKETHKDGADRLARVLNAIEEASRRYAASYGHPLVLVIDGVDYLAKKKPAILERIQDKGKLWADAGIVKLVLVTSQDDTESLLRDNRSAWSRADKPLSISDLPADSAITLLRTDLSGSGRDVLCAQSAARVYGLVGGRIQDLLSFKRDCAQGTPPEVTAIALVEKERDKLPLLPPAAKEVLKKLCEARDEKLPLDAVEQGVQVLLQRGIVRLERDECTMNVTFASTLTKNTARAFVQKKKIFF